MSHCYVIKKDICLLVCVTVWSSSHQNFFFDSHRVQAITATAAWHIQWSRYGHFFTCLFSFYFKWQLQITLKLVRISFKGYLSSKGASFANGGFFFNWQTPQRKPQKTGNNIFRDQNLPKISLICIQETGLINVKIASPLRSRSKKNLFLPDHDDRRQLELQVTHHAHTRMQDLQHFLRYCAVFRFRFNKNLKENLVPSLVIRYTPFIL